MVLLGAPRLNNSISGTNPLTARKIHNSRTPKMICRSPTLQRLCPPISMKRAAMRPTNGATDPYGPVQGAPGWVWWRNGWFAYYKLTSE